MEISLMQLFLLICIKFSLQVSVFHVQIKNYFVPICNSECSMPYVKSTTQGKGILPFKKVRRPYSSTDLHTFHPDCISKCYVFVFILFLLFKSILRICFIPAYVVHKYLHKSYYNLYVNVALCNDIKLLETCP